MLEECEIVEDVEKNDIEKNINLHFEDIASCCEHYSNLPVYPFLNNNNNNNNN
jgi:hypothetical protein